MLAITVDGVQMMMLDMCISTADIRSQAFVAASLQTALYSAVQRVFSLTILSLSLPSSLLFNVVARCIVDFRL